MKKKILRNIAFVSAIFIATLSIMLVTNYFQARGTTPLQTEVVETLKELNDQNASNPVIQEQIRQLDLLARKAYFVQTNHLKVGVFILLGMLAVFLLCVRLYFASDKHIPDKNIDPIDEWAIKTKARKYVVGLATGSAAIALVFAFISAINMSSAEVGEIREAGETGEYRGVLHTPIVGEAGETEEVEDTTEHSKGASPLVV